MTPSARLQAAIDILADLDTTDRPADRVLRGWGRAHRYAGSKDRAAIGERVFDILRHRASFIWRMGSDAPRALAIAALLKEGKSKAEIAALFSGERYAPTKLTDDERQRIVHEPADAAPSHVRGEFPQFLESELRAAFGDNLLQEMHALTARAAVDLRVNRLKAKRDAVLSALRDQGFAAEAAPFSPDGIRIPSGPDLSQLTQHALFKDGRFVFQDEAAQIASLLCQAKPGERILDIAAGAGGKSLALAAIMENRGEIIASDIRADALAELQRRAAVAGASIVQTAAQPDGLFDAVCVDAPCSGSGTWRRQPESKWRLTPERLKQLNATQEELLRRAAHHVRPGGCLLYATCSILPRENEWQVQAFLERHADFAIKPARAIWRDIGMGEPPPGMEDFFRASPFTTGTDGFFAAVMQNEGP